MCVCGGWNLKECLGRLCFSLAKGTLLQEEMGNRQPADWLSGLGVHWNHLRSSKKGTLTCPSLEILFFGCFFFFLRFFWCRPFKKYLLNLFQYCFCFMLWFFGHQPCEILAPWPGMESAPPASEGETSSLDCQGSPLRFCFVCCAGSASGFETHSPGWF